MARKPLRSQLNQIRAWVRQGRTDAWIAHQLDVSASELREFRRRHELSPEGEDTGEVELRDEIEAEIEALSEAEEEEEEEEEEEAPEAPEAEKAPAGAEKSEGEPTGRRRRRRRRRRGGGGGDGPGAAMQATFDHGDTDGFGLWLDPAVEDDPVYSENWAGHRKVEVTIEPDRIVVRRV
ncbi:MAG: hypothetical protein ACJ75I_05395 [Solirubrobacterales bacterium]